ncbi:MAG TPA: hypothetical protein VF712_14090 [Thermoleophilaceae bacterium]|jgi:hypothetical protein
MSFLGRRARGREAASPETASSEADQALTDRYAKLDDRQAVATLAGLSQVELTAIACFERSHRERAPVLDTLRHLRQPEPLPGYDALEPNAIPEALAGADTGMVEAVREYERRHQNRTSVNVAIATALRSLRDQPAIAVDGAPAPPPAVSGPPAARNGLPIKTPPETGLGTP